MTQVTVRVEDFEDGAFPMLCVSSGVPVAKRRRATARYEPAWPLIFLVLGFIGLIIYVVAMPALTRTVEGWVPMDQELAGRGDRERWRWSRRALGLAVATAAAAALLVLSEAVLVGVLVLLVGLAGAAGCIFRAARPVGWVRARFAPDGRTVTMKPVHADFVEAYEAQEWRRQAERREDASRR